MKKNIIILVLLFSLNTSSVFAAENSKLNQSLIVNVDPVKNACFYIYKGDFDAAQDAILYQENRTDAVLQLSEVIKEYKIIESDREKVRYDLFKEHLDELEDLQSKVDINDITYSSDINDINDVNNITTILSVIAKAGEYAAETDKPVLLADNFVKKIIIKSQNIASDLENEGKWLDAYISCYTWLTAIDKDNSSYEDYAQQLLDKANIAAGFEDSPCETSEERFYGIKALMFEKTIDVLKFGHVKVVSYSEMAQKAIDRCKLLSDVLMTKNASDPNKFEIDKSKYSSWIDGLNKISREVENSLIGISKDKFKSIFRQTLDLNKETVNMHEPILIANFVESALGALDQYTNMIWPRQVKEFDKMMTNEFTGIGIEISKRGGFLTVSSLLPDTPAYFSGLDADDIILEVDGIETKDMTLTCAVRHITGPKDTDVTLTVKAPSEDKTRKITITRGVITVRTIRGWQRLDDGDWQYVIDDKNKIGYIRMTNFSEKTSSEFEEVLKQLEKNKMQALILDLRFNPGGLLSTAAEITDKFIDDGLVVTTRPRFGIWTYLSAHKKGTHPYYPLVVLINSGSASASEIVSGALADKTHQRATLVGQRTHGKGSVQTITNYPGDTAKLKYTMAYYHLPSGQRVESKDAMKKQGREDWGVAPDVEVVLRSNEVKKMFDVRRDNDVLVKSGHDNGKTPLKRHGVDEVVESDPQLAVGLLVARTKLIEKSLNKTP